MNALRGLLLGTPAALGTDIGVLAFGDGRDHHGSPAAASLDPVADHLELRPRAAVCAILEACVAPRS